MAAVTDVVNAFSGVENIENIHNFGTSGLSEDFRSVLDSSELAGHHGTATDFKIFKKTHL